ncbi:MAG: alcohol dehydrogenase catalytic domain-containing protein [Phycisphaerales bacterium]
MRACVLDGTQVRIDRDRAAPRPGPGEALVRPVVVGLSALDRAGLGNPEKSPRVLGHEFVGVVEHVEGQHAPSIVGRRVACAPDVVCGACDMCRSGLALHCRSRKVIGVDGRDGALAEWVVVPASNLAPLPESVPDDAGVFAVAISAAVQAAERIAGRDGAFVTVLGAGAEAVLTAQVVAGINASVRLVSGAKPALDACERLGVTARHVEEAGQRADQDVVIDCTASARGARTALRMLRPRGTLVLQGVPPDEALDLAVVVDREIEILGSRRAPIGRAVDLLARGRVSVEGLITRRVALEQAPLAFQRIDEPGELKIVVDIR